MKQIIKDNLSSIITGLVSLVALSFAFVQTDSSIKSSERMVERQLRVQLATTIEKEWTNDVKRYSASLIENAFLVSWHTLNK